MISSPVTAVPQRWRCGRHSVIVKNVDYLQSWPCEHNKDIIPIDTRRFLSSLVSRIMLCTSYDLPLSFESTVSPNSSTMWWKMNGQTMISFPSTHLTSSIDTDRLFQFDIHVGGFFVCNSVKIVWLHWKIFLIILADIFQRRCRAMRKVRGWISTTNRQVLKSERSESIY